jgi:hypothetical protein
METTKISVKINENPPDIRVEQLLNTNLSLHKSVQLGSCVMYCDILSAVCCTSDEGKVAPVLN